jgi:hypothetical protein
VNPERIELLILTILILVMSVTTHEWRSPFGPTAKGAAAGSALGEKNRCEAPVPRSAVHCRPLFGTQLGIVTSGQKTGPWLRPVV